MHRVACARETEDQPVAWSNDLSVEPALRRSTRAGAGPPHTLESVEYEYPLAHLLRQPTTRRGLPSPPPTPASHGPVAPWSESKHPQALRPSVCVPGHQPTPGAGTFPGPAGSPPPGTSGGQEYADLTVVDSPCRAAIPAVHPNRLVPILPEPGLVHHQDRGSVGQILHHMPPRIIAEQVGIPAVVVQRALHSVGSGVARPLRQRPAVLALHRAKPPLQVFQHTTARLGTPEPHSDTLVHPVQSLGPPGNLRHVISTPNHALTSAALSCPDSARS